MKEFKAWLFDGDGVLYLLNQRIKGGKELINHLRSERKLIYLISNNSTKTLDQYVSKLQTMDIHIPKENIITSAYVTAEYLAKNYDFKFVFAVGEGGLTDALVSNNFLITDEIDKIEAVIVGMDRAFTYRKAEIASRAILRGAKFFATNPDKSFPTPEGLSPGAGAMIATINATTEQKPEIIFGKPNKYLFEKALSLSGLQKEEVVMVGDRIDTDILGATNNGIHSILVRTGVSSDKPIDILKSEMNTYGVNPDVFSSCEEIYQFILNRE